MNFSHPKTSCLDSGCACPGSILTTFCYFRSFSMAHPRFSQSCRGESSRIVEKPHLVQATVDGVVLQTLLESMRIWHFVDEKRDARYSTFQCFRVELTIWILKTAVFDFPGSWASVSCHLLSSAIQWHVLQLSYCESFRIYLPQLLNFSTVDCSSGTGYNWRGKYRVRKCSMLIHIIYPRCCRGRGKRIS